MPHSLNEHPHHPAYGGYTPPVPPVFDYPVDAPSTPAKRPRKTPSWRTLAVVGVSVAVIVAIIAAFFAYGNKEPAPAPSVAAADFKDYCADNTDSASLRAKLLYTDARYMNKVPEQVSEDSSQHWCVIGTSYDSDLWWGVVYVGADNPLYRTMLSENGKADDATRAVITYQGVPPIKFARDGWIGFITPSEDTWSAFRTGAGAMLLYNIAQQAHG